MASSHLIFLGTYTRSTSRGIYAVQLDRNTGALSTPTLVAQAVNPAWIAFSPDRRFLYTLHPSQAQATAFTVDRTQEKLVPLVSTAPDDAARRAATAAPPSHLAIDATGRTLVAANYADGYVAAIPIRADGTLGAPTSVKHHGKGTHPTRQEKPHAHSVTLSPDNRHVIVCDLGVDKIFSYALDPATATLTPARSPFVATDPGAGPRHFKFGADGRHAYAINELANTVTAYDYDAESGGLAPKQTLSTLPAGFDGENTTAEVRVHPNGRFLYGSNRGHDSIAVYAIDDADGKLSLVDIVASGGKTPRNFALSPDGEWLVCGHQETDIVTVLRVDPSSGRLTRTEHSAAVPMCVCVLFDA